MRCNVSVSGGRWRCASPACDQFVSYQELQYCGLTEDAITTFRSDLSPQRNRVEFREDGTYRLLPPQRLRYGGRKRPSATRNNGNNDNKPAVKQRQVEIEEIVID
jgi:hypothetical protein